MDPAVNQRLQTRSCYEEVSRRSAGYYSDDVEPRHNSVHRFIKARDRDLDRQSTYGL
jgi:hypothetical protein